MRAKCYLLWHIMVFNFRVCLVWPYICGLVWSCCFLWSLTCVAWCGLIWPLYGLIQSFMAFYGQILSFLAVIDPNSFGLVYFDCPSFDCNVFLCRMKSEINQSAIIPLFHRHSTIQTEIRVIFVCAYHGAANRGHNPKVNLKEQ